MSNSRMKMILLFYGEKKLRLTRLPLAKERYVHVSMNLLDFFVIYIDPGSLVIG